MKKIKIFFSSDNNYFKQLFVSISSLIDNCSNKKIIEILVLDGGIEEHNIKEIERYCRQKNTSIRFLKIDGSKYIQLKTLSHISKSPFYRIEIPKMFPEDKIIYLDCDIVVKEDIIPLNNIELNGKILGATCDTYLRYFKNEDQFNAGVLIIDCKAWNNKKISEKISRIIKSKKISNMADQKILNDVLKNDWQELPLEWNRQKRIFEQTPEEIKVNKIVYRLLLKSPKIIHYTGKIKPWHYKYIFPDKKEYVKYLKKCGFEEDYPDKTFFNFFIYNPLRWIVYKLKIRRVIER